VEPDLRADVWLKLMGNAAFNPLSVITHGTMESKPPSWSRDAAIAPAAGQERAVRHECIRRRHDGWTRGIAQ
jgi:hypothetical protein